MSQMFRRQQVLWNALWVRYAIAVAAVAAGFLLRKGVTAYVGPELPTYITFYPAVMVAALLAGLGPGLLATVLVVALVDYYIVSPREMFWSGHPAEAAGVVLFSLMGLFLTVLTELYRRAREKMAAFDRELALRENQEALKQAAELHRQALEAGKLGTWNYNFLTGDVFADERCQGLFGFTQGDRIDYPNTIKRIHEADRERVDRAVQAALAPDSTGAYEQEYRVVWPNGSTRWILAKGRVYFQGEDDQRRPQRFVGTVQDTTESRRVEQALQTERDRAQQYLNIAGTILVSLAPDQTITLINKKGCELLGYARDELVGKNWFDVILPEHERENVKARFARLMRGEVEPLEHADNKVVTRRGEMRMISWHNALVRDAAGNITGTLSSGEDITERKEAEKALRQAHDQLEIRVQERTAELRQANDQLRQEIEIRRQTERQLTETELRYRTVADFTHDWEFWETPEGALRYCSPSCEQVTGYSAREFTADPSLLQQIVHPEDADLWQKHKHETLARPGPGMVEFRIQRKDGCIRWVEHVCRPILGEAGSFLGIRASNRDVTQRRVTESETQQLREELAHVTRVTTAGQFAASLAHELNQPLTAIRCNTQTAQQLMAASPPNVAEIRETLDDIAYDSERAGEVIRRLRALFNKTGHSRTVLDINEIIEETFNLLRSEFLLKGVSTQLHLEPALPKVLGDRIAVQQVVLNLIVNALEAMVEVPTPSRSLHISTGQESPAMIRASFRDFGPGIPEPLLSRLFEPFYTTKANGMGMGLAIAQSIIEAHCGGLRAVNNSDQGATLHLILPIHHQEHP